MIEPCSTCSKCYQKYTMDSLCEYLHIHGNAISWYNRNDFEEIQNQMDMQICGKCRVNNYPCGGCRGCLPPGAPSELCPNCLYYGFNHPINIYGKCLNCGPY